MRLLKILLSFLPRKLPTGMTSFNSWVKDIIVISGLPDNDSTRKVSAMFVLQVPPSIGYMSIRKVSNILVKAAANQVAVEVLKDLDAKSGEVPTITTQVVSEVKV